MADEPNAPVEDLLARLRPWEVEALEINGDWEAGDRSAEPQRMAALKTQLQAALDNASLISGVWPVALGVRSYFAR